MISGASERRVRLGGSEEEVAAEEETASASVERGRPRLVLRNRAVAYFQHTATAGNVTLCANIWDTAGQERFRGVNALYLRKAAAAILTFDVTQRASFDDLAEWHRRVVDAAVKGVIIVIAANKCDSPPSRRQVSEEVRDILSQSWRTRTRRTRTTNGCLHFAPVVQEGRAFAEEHGASYVETSAKTGKGVKELFEVIGALAGAHGAPPRLRLSVGLQPHLFRVPESLGAQRSARRRSCS